MLFTWAIHTFILNALDCGILRIQSPDFFHGWYSRKRPQFPLGSPAFPSFLFWMFTVACIVWIRRTCVYIWPFETYLCVQFRRCASLQELRNTSSNFDVLSRVGVIVRIVIDLCFSDHDMPYPTFSRRRPSFSSCRLIPGDQLWNTMPPGGPAVKHYAPRRTSYRQHH